MPFGWKVSLANTKQGKGVSKITVLTTTAKELGVSGEETTAFELGLPPTSKNCVANLPYPCKNKEKTHPHRRPVLLFSLTTIEETFKLEKETQTL